MYLLMRHLKLLIKKILEDQLNLVPEKVQCIYST